MGYALAYGVCCDCKQPMSFNPILVPSTRVNGVKKPVCQSCLHRLNQKRLMSGLEPFVAPPGAYDACEEAELGYDD